MPSRPADSFRVYRWRSGSLPEMIGWDDRAGLFRAFTAKISRKSTRNRCVAASCIARGVPAPIFSGATAPGCTQQLVAAASSALSVSRARTIVAERRSHRHAQKFAPLVRLAVATTACRDCRRSAAGSRTPPLARPACPPTAEIRRVLLDVWDPIGVKDESNAQDE